VAICRSFPLRRLGKNTRVARKLLSLQETCDGAAEGPTSPSPW